MTPPNLCIQSIHRNHGMCQEKCIPCKQGVRQMKEKKTEVITLRTTETVKKKLTEEAEIRGWTVSQLAEKILAVYTDQEKQKPQINFISNQIEKININ